VSFMKEKPVVFLSVPHTLHGQRCSRDETRGLLVSGDDGCCCMVVGEKGCCKFLEGTLKERLVRDMVCLVVEESCSGVLAIRRERKMVSIIIPMSDT
jgi:hypothetical protein